MPPFLTEVLGARAGLFLNSNLHSRRVFCSARAVTNGYISYPLYSVESGTGRLLTIQMKMHWIMVCGMTESWYRLMYIRQDKSSTKYLLIFFPCPTDSRQLPGSLFKIPKKGDDGTTVYTRFPAHRYKRKNDDTCSTIHLFSILKHGLSLTHNSFP